MIPTPKSMWTSEQSPEVIFLEILVGAKYVIALYAHGLVWEVPGI